LLIAGAALCWGFTAALAKFLFLRNIDPLTLAQVRASFSFLLLLGFTLLRRRAGRGRLRVEPRLAAGLALLGVLGIAASNYTYLMAIHLSNVTTAILVQYTAPVWVTLYSALFASERMSLRKVLAILLSFGGCLLAVGAYRAGELAFNAAGVAYALAAAFTFSFFNIWGRRMAQRVELWTSLLHALGAASIFWALVRSPVRLLESGHSGAQWAVFFAYAVISILVPFSLFFAGLRRLPATHAIVTSTLEPPFAILFAFLLVAERPALPQFLGMAAVISAVVLLQRS
jgi:drug/metabolite transporter (DMT)-like permease